MKTLLSTTAILLSLSCPALLLAQTAPTKATTGQSATGMPGFLAARGPSDVYATDLMGHAVHARRAVTATDGKASKADQTAMAADGTGGLRTMPRTDLDSMDSIGQITEIVLSNDGQVRAIVIGVGGFLGMGEQEVAVTMDQMTFATDPDDRSEMFVIVNTSADMLKGSPRYERAALTGDRSAARAGTDALAGNRTPFVAPTVARDGYNPVVVTEVSSEMLVGKPVYGVNDDPVGTIDDLIVDDKGAITNVIIDFGGFLGIGASQVSVGFDELTILGNDGRADVRVYVDATREQVQAQPQYRAIN
jgi:hypothetical protein